MPYRQLPLPLMAAVSTCTKVATVVGFRCVGVIVAGLFYSETLFLPVDSWHHESKDSQVSPNP
jgi:hypothetical protein